MKIARYDDERVGFVDGETIVDLAPFIAELPTARWPYPNGDAFITHLPQLLRATSDSAVGSSRRPLADAVFLAPIANVGKVVAAPVNYHAHLVEAEETPGIRFDKAIRKIGDAGLFLKASSSIVGSSAGIAVRFPERRTDHEVELAVVIGRTCRGCSADDALDYVAGYTIGLDMTIRGVEDRSFRKSIDSYTVLGPWLVTADEIDDPNSLALSLRVNGVIRQQSNTTNLIVGVQKLIAWAAEWYTLYPGDVLMTGTPEGVGPVVEGDRIDATIERIGTMTTFVSSAVTAAVR